MTYYIKLAIYKLRKGLGMDNEVERVVLRSGVDRAISVGSAILRDNIDLGNREPMYAVWTEHKEEPDYIFNRILLIDGTGRTEFIENYNKPLPGNSGRTIAYVVTDAEIHGFINKNRPPVKARQPGQPVQEKKATWPC